jgi:catechol 2,3-dioxygenase-like lactoylglutathione lyase family enzyme
MSMAARGNVHRLYHLNVNCTDFDVSLAFYRMLGFSVVLEFDPLITFGEAGLGPVLGLPNDCRGRAALLALGDQPHAMRIDLIEWQSPEVPKGPAPDLARPGFGRICLKLSDAEAMHADLVAAGYKPYSQPTRISLAGSDLKVFCVEDPDGVVIEFMEFLPQS